MKINPVTLIISLAISGLIAYGFYSVWNGEQGSDLHLATTFFSFLFSTITLSSTISINFETERITTVIRTVAGVFFFLGLGTLILITKLTDSLPFLVIGMGVLSLVFILIAYSISKSGQ